MFLVCVWGSRGPSELQVNPIFPLTWGSGTQEAGESFEVLPPAESPVLGPACAWSPWEPLLWPAPLCPACSGLYPMGGSPPFAVSLGFPTCPAI